MARAHCVKQAGGHSGGDPWQSREGLNRIDRSAMTVRPYVSLLRALADAGVEYVVAGGFAVVLHGVPRMTFDLDIVVDLADDNMLRLVAALAAEGFRPRLPVALTDLEAPEKRREWIETRNLVAFSLTHPQRPMEELNVLLVIPFSWAEFAASRVWRSIEGVSVPVVGRALLRRMKLATGRARDAADAALLGDADE